MVDFSHSLPDLDDLLDAVAEVQELYPHTPPLVFWRAYERALYLRFAPRLEEPVLDVGCGDGLFFSSLWPGCREVDGVDCDASAVAQARGSGRYREVWHGFAHDSALPLERYGTAISNCALEHMDELPQVLKKIHASLRPGGRCLASVVTDRFLAWASLPGIFAQAGPSGAAQATHIQSAYENYHHLRNALTIAAWKSALVTAGFSVERAAPFLGEFSSRLFLFLDNLWHLGAEHGDPCGPRLERYLAGFPDFGAALRKLIEGAYLAERDRENGSGLFIVATKGPAASGS